MLKLKEEYTVMCKFWLGVCIIVESNNISNSINIFQPKQYSLNCIILVCIIFVCIIFVVWVKNCPK